MGSGGSTRSRTSSACFLLRAQSSAPGARGGAGSGSSMPQAALALDVTLFPPLAGVAAATEAGRTGVAVAVLLLEPLELLPPPGRGRAAPASGRGRHLPLVLVLRGDLVSGGGELRGQVSGTEGERGQGLAGGGRIGGQGLAPVLPDEHGAAGA
uniref:Uncharacterized protein n=1 Tax=Aegilops tauschii subsp. strangulata TaxID=200361 RepID=A0A453G5X8_AEGTS